MLVLAVLRHDQRAADLAGGNDVVGHHHPPLDATR